jgi:hypothetical protein
MGKFVVGVMVASVCLLWGSAASSKDASSPFEFFVSTTSFSEWRGDGMTRYVLSCETIDPKTKQRIIPPVGRTATAIRCHISFSTLQLKRVFAGQKGIEDLKPGDMQKLRDNFATEKELKTTLSSPEAKKAENALGRKYIEQMLQLRALLDAKRDEEAYKYLQDNSYNLCELSVFHNDNPSAAGRIFRRINVDSWVSDGEEVNCRVGDDPWPNPELKSRQVFFLRRLKGKFSFTLSEKKCGQPEKPWGTMDRAFQEEAAPFKCDQYQF